MVKDFKPGYLVLKWDGRRGDKKKHGKLDSLWIDPFRVNIVQYNNTYELSHKDGDVLGEPINGRFLKRFFHY